VSKIREIDWKSIPTTDDWWTEYAALERYCEEVRGRVRGVDWAIEVGSYFGRSAALLAQYFPRVLAIDLGGDVINGLADYDAIGQNSFPGLLRNIVKHGLVDVVFPVMATSKFMEGVPSLRAGLIFVDAAHFEAEVGVDIERLVPHLHPRGLLVCHDYARSPKWKAATKGVDAAVARAGMKLFNHTEGIAAFTWI
jgi:hypothetical protein